MSSSDKKTSWYNLFGELVLAIQYKYLFIGNHSFLPKRAQQSLQTLELNYNTKTGNSQKIEVNPLFFHRNIRHFSASKIPTLEKMCKYKFYCFFIN